MQFGLITHLPLWSRHAPSLGFKNSIRHGKTAIFCTLRQFVSGSGDWRYTRAPAHWWRTSHSHWRTFYLCRSSGRRLVNWSGPPAGAAWQCYPALSRLRCCGHALETTSLSWKLACGCAPLPLLCALPAKIKALFTQYQP